MRRDHYERPNSISTAGPTAAPDLSGSDRVDRQWDRRLRLERKSAAAFPDRMGWYRLLALSPVRPGIAGAAGRPLGPVLLHRRRSGAGGAPLSRARSGGLCLGRGRLAGLPGPERQPPHGLSPAGRRRFPGGGGCLCLCPAAAGWDRLAGWTGPGARHSGLRLPGGRRPGVVFPAAESIAAVTVSYRRKRAAPCGAARFFMGHIPFSEEALSRISAGSLSPLPGSGPRPDTHTAWRCLHRLWPR